MSDERLVSALSSTLSTSEELSSDISIQDSPAELVAELQRKKIDRLSEEIEDVKQDRSQRKIFSYCIFGFMCTYMAASLVIVFFCGFGLMALNESVLIALLTTTLANVIGVFNFVAKYLFHK